MRKVEHSAQLAVLDAEANEAKRRAAEQDWSRDQIGRAQELRESRRAEPGTALVAPWPSRIGMSRRLPPAVTRTAAAARVFVGEDMLGVVKCQWMSDGMKALHSVSADTPPAKDVGKAPVGPKRTDSDKAASQAS
jgi:hypothetical protein